MVRDTGAVAILAMLLLPVPLLSLCNLVPLSSLALPQVVAIANDKFESY